MALSITKVPLFLWVISLVTKKLSHMIFLPHWSYHNSIYPFSPHSLLWSLMAFIQRLSLLNLSVFSMSTHHWYKKHSLLAIPKHPVSFYVNIPGSVTSLLCWSNHNSDYTSTLTATLFPGKKIIQSIFRSQEMAYEISDDLLIYGGYSQGWVEK